MQTTILIIIAILIETSRMILIGKDLREIARSKGELPTKWMVGGISIWVVIEIITIMVWQYFSRGYLVIGGLVLGILIARIVYFFYKRLLTQKPDRDFDTMIDQIGKPEE
jgi:hypothetical protein